MDSPSACGLGGGLRTHHRKKPASYRILHRSLDLDEFFAMI